MSLVLLQEWYVKQCDGEWEHGYGVKIDTLDNPGWSVRIDLTGTAQVDLAFRSIEIHRSDDDWCVCRVVANVFEGFGGARNLGELLDAFLLWVEHSSAPK